MSNKKDKLGSIYYDKNKQKFRCTYYSTDNNTLVETRKTKSFSTEEEAKNFLLLIQCQKGSELYTKNNGIPLNQLLKILTAKKLDNNIIKEGQYSRLLYSIKNIERSPIAYKSIEEIESKEIQEYLVTLKNYSESTIKKITGLLNQAFSYSLNKGYITKNPMTDIIRPKSTKQVKIVRALTLEEQQQFTNYLMQIPRSDEPFKVAYLIEMYLGLRIGEVLALKTSDIDLSKNLIKVNKTLTIDKDNKFIMGDATKTYAGTREVPIPSFIKEEIISQMKLADNNKEHLLFVDSRNNYMSPTNANRLLKRTLKQMGIENISTHSLRHTYGTRCIEAGMRAVALQRLMGHTDISITLNTYTSVFNKYKEAELEKVNDYYMNNEIINVTPLKLPNEDNIISSKEKQITELSKMVETSFANGIIRFEEYQKNLKYLQDLKKQLDTEEKGFDER